MLIQMVCFTGKSIHASYSDVKTMLHILSDKIYGKEIKINLELVAAQSEILCGSIINA